MRPREAESLLKNVLPFNTMAMSMGLHPRCGIEDTIIDQHGKPFTSVQQIQQTVRVAHELGREIAQRRHDAARAHTDARAQRGATMGEAEAGGQVLDYTLQRDGRVVVRFSQTGKNRPKAVQVLRSRALTWLKP